MKFPVNILLVSAALVFMVLPALAFAQAPSSPPSSTIIPCGFDGPDADRTVGPSEACNFNHLIILAQNVINFLIFKIAAPLAAIMFAYAGFLYVTNRGNEGQIKQAHDIFLYVFWGFVVCLAAWLIIYFITSFFLDPTYILLAPPTR